MYTKSCSHSLVLTICLIVSLLSAVLLGCQQKWYFKITDLSDSSKPKFCISRSRSFICSDTYGVSLVSLGIWESNEKGEYVKQVWGIEAIGDSTISAFTYGVAPEGYKETKRAVPIVIGKIYIMDNLRYFRLIEEGDTVVAEIFDHKKFVDTFKHQ